METDPGAASLQKYTSGDEDIAIVKVQEVNPNFDRRLRPALKVGMEELMRQLKARGEGRLEGVLGQYNREPPSPILYPILNFKMYINTVPPTSHPWPPLPREFYVGSGQGQASRTKVRIIPTGLPGDGFDRIHFALILNSTIDWCEALSSTEPVPIKVGREVDVDFTMSYEPREGYPGSTDLAMECRMLVTLRDLFDVKKYEAISFNFLWYDDMNRVMGSGYMKLENG